MTKELRSGSVKVMPPSNVDRPMRYVQSSEPIDLVSYGTEEGLRGASKGARTTLDRSYLVPGDTTLTRQGLYTYPVSQGGRGSTYARASEGSPAKMKIRMPRKRVLISDIERPEVIIPGRHIGSNVFSLIERI